jgi:hypothetical protein
MSKYKYNIIYHVRQLPWENYKTAIEDIARVCSVSPTTVRKWIYLRKEDNYDISFGNILRVADFFSIQPKDLIND